VEKSISIDLMLGSAFQLDCYEGAYGPTIRIEVALPHGLEQLAALFAQLANSSREAIDLMKFGTSVTEQVQEIILQSTDGGVVSTSDFSPVRVGESSAWRWVGRPVNWLECQHMIEGMLQYGGPCHQYLTDPDLAKYVVVVSYRE
jgi:hypothetical protein